MTDWTKAYVTAYHHNIPFSSLAPEARRFYNIGFTEIELGVSFKFDRSSNVSFERFNPLKDLGRQLNLEPVPQNPGYAVELPANTPVLHSYGTPHAAQNTAADRA